MPVRGRSAASIGYTSLCPALLSELLLRAKSIRVYFGSVRCRFRSNGLVQRSLSAGEGNDNKKFSGSAPEIVRRFLAADRIAFSSVIFHKC